MLASLTAPPASASSPLDTVDVTLAMLARAAGPPDFRALAAVERALPCRLPTATPKDPLALVAPASATIAASTGVGPLARLLVAAGSVCDKRFGVNDGGGGGGGMGSGGGGGTGDCGESSTLSTRSVAAGVDDDAAAPSRAKRRDAARAAL